MSHQDPARTRLTQHSAIGSSSDFPWFPRNFLSSISSECGAWPQFLPAHARLHLVQSGSLVSSFALLCSAVIRDWAHDGEAGGWAPCQGSASTGGHYQLYIIHTSVPQF